MLQMTHHVPINHFSRLTSGDRLWNGVVVWPKLAEDYNDIQDRIQTYIDAGRTPPETLLNYSHRLLNMPPDMIEKLQ